MKKVILIVLASFLLISSFCFVVFGKNRQNKNEIVNNNVALKNDLEEDNSVEGAARFSKIVLPVQEQEHQDVIKKEKINIQKIDNLNLEKIINDFQDQKFFIKKDISDFVQISDKNIVRGEILNNQCVLNMASYESELSICDFAKLECSNLECEKFDCMEFKNKWFKVSYYGGFVGSGDKELIYKNKNKIIIANLECDDKTKENYENNLFIKLIN